MKTPAIVLFASLLSLCSSQPSRAVMFELSTTNRYLAVTNTSPSSEVRPLASYILFPTPATGTVAISRVTRGVHVPLARHSFTNVSGLTWLAPADFPIRRGEAFAVSSTVARFTLQLEISNGSEDVRRTDAPEWYDDGRPFAFQIAGGGSTHVTVSNAPQYVITNNIVVTNAITVNAGAGGGYIPNDATFVTTNGTLNLWDTGTSLNFGLKDGEWYSFMRDSTIGLRGESAQIYSIGYVDDLGPTPHMTFTDPTSGTVTLADLLAGGGGGAYIPSLGPWATTNDANAELRFIGGTMNAKIEGTVSGGGLWSMDGPTLALANLYNAGNGNILLQMGAANEGDFTVTLPSGSVLTLDDTVGSKNAVLKGTYDDAGNPVAGFELAASKLTLRNNFNAGINPVSIEVDTNGDIKFTDFANTGLLLKNVVRWVTAPSAANDSGTAGDAAYDASFLYVCVAADTWLRVAIATW